MKRFILESFIYVCNKLWSYLSLPFWFLECTSKVIPLTTSCLVWLGFLLLFYFLKLTHKVQLVLTSCVSVRSQHLECGKLISSHILKKKKDDAPSSSKYLLPIDPQYMAGLEDYQCFHARVLACLILCGSSSGNQSCYEIMMVVAGLCPKDSTSQCALYPPALALSFHLLFYNVPWALVVLR